MQDAENMLLFVLQFNEIIQKMRGSPISNFRRGNQYSPYESNPMSSNLVSDSSYSGELQYWRAKTRELEAQVIALNKQLTFQARQNQKTNDLEDKIELLLAQNTHFVEENENLIKLVQQKNSDIDVWKRKFDTQFTHSSIAEAQKKRVFDHLNIKDEEHQIQIQKLLAEIHRLQNETIEMQNKNEIEIHRLKNQYESQSVAQIQNLRRSQNGNSEMQELNIRKLKDTIQEKNFEIDNLTRQLRLKAEEMKAEINYSRNELKKLDQQKSHELDLMTAEFENTRNSLARQHKKKEDELKNLHEAKVKRLQYEIEEKKHQIEETHGRIKRTGKEGETDMVRLINENETLRAQIKENDNKNHTRIDELTAFYDDKFAKERQANVLREANLSAHYSNEIAILQDVIAAKEEETQRILKTNKDLKRNEDARLHQIKQNNYELKSKISEIVNHYQREIELSKIKISQLYEADISALKSKLENSYATHTLQNNTLKELLNEFRIKLANEVQDKLDLRRDYELRLSEFALSHDRVQKELKTVIAQREKEVEGHTSKASLTHISHNQLLQSRNFDMKQVMSDKRIIEGQLVTKNKEIEALNLKIQQMLGLHKRDIEKLEEEIEKRNQKHSEWLVRQEKETADWQSERLQLNEKINDLSKTISQIKKDHQLKENLLNKSINEKNMEIAKLQGVVQQLEQTIKSLGSKSKVQVQNVEKTILQTRTLMNSEKEKFFEIVNREKSLVESEYTHIKHELERQIADLQKQNEILHDNYRKLQVREAELKQDVQGLTESVNQRGQLEERVINIGLSNNYIKNVAEIYKKDISK